MQLFFSSDILPHSSEVTLSKEESNHCVSVMRHRVGDTIWVIDGRGGLYQCQLATADAKKSLLKVVEYTPSYGKLPYKLHMAVAPTKSIDRYEWFLEKATEIGVDRFTPIESYNSERRVIKDERSLRVILSAVKQSVKAFIPGNDPLTKFNAFVASDFGSATKLIAHCHDSQDKRPLKEIITEGGEYVIMIGPEGDFSAQEVALAKKHGFREISLGDSRLRSETAALFSVAAISFTNYRIYDKNEYANT